MKYFFTAILILASQFATGAEPPDDGFYLRLDDESSSRITSQDGRVLFLGEKQDLGVQKSELTSQMNVNKGFMLTVTVPYDKDIGPSTYILIVAGTAYRQSGSSSSHKETSALNFYILEEEKIKQVSEYMKTPIVNRRHPRHNLLISFTPTEEEFNTGEEVTVIHRIKNVGTNELSFMNGGRTRAIRDNQYVFLAHNRGEQVQDIGNYGHFGGIAERIFLKPGEEFENTISLSKWFSFDKSGTYFILGTYYLNFNDPEADSPRTIWEDFISAEFTVRIKDTDKTLNQSDTGDGN